MRRNPGIPIFKGNEQRTARERVTDILRGFRERANLPPVEVIRRSDGVHPNRLQNGTHRLYCSLAAGFTHIHAIDGWEFEN